jgi:hypothetical protein
MMATMGLKLEKLKARKYHRTRVLENQTKETVKLSL